MKAIILAAGRGSRLGSLTDEQPKCLTVVGSRKLLEWQINALRNGGVDEVVIVSGYRSEMLESYGCKTILNADWSNTNMVASLLCAKELFSEPLIVSYSDIVYSADIIKRLIEVKKEAVISYDVSWLDLWSRRFENPLSDAESFVIDENNYVQEIGKRVDNVSEIQGQYMGLLKFSPAAFQRIVSMVNKAPDQGRQMDMTTLLSNMINSDNPLYGLPCSGGWCEVDDESDLRVAENLFVEGKILFSSQLSEEG